MSGPTLLPALGVAAGLATAAGLALGWAAARLRDDPHSLADRIDALLPQTQCGQCLYPGCRPYARAIADGAADIDRCPPGGEATVRALAALLGRAPRAVDPRYGATKPRLVALIDEERCIGCALCLPACPVDAIVGAPRFVHTVLEAACTGCELCLPPCPVDCIELRAPGRPHDDRCDVRNRGAERAELLHQALQAGADHAVTGDRSRSAAGPAGRAGP